ncbi:MAG: hypothetical protein ACI898_001872, partial [Flavobacteriales bacterium]
MKTNLFSTFVFLLMVSSSADAQVAKKELYEGNIAYQEGNYTKADSLYQLGTQKGAPEGITSYNRGNTF